MDLRPRPHPRQSTVEVKIIVEVQTKSASQTIFSRLRCSQAMDTVTVTSKVNRNLKARGDKLKILENSVRKSGDGGENSTN